MKVGVGFRGGDNTGDRGLARLGALVVGEASCDRKDRVAGQRPATRTSPSVSIRLDQRADAVKEALETELEERVEVEGARGDACQ